MSKIQYKILQQTLPPLLAGRGWSVYRLASEMENVGASCTHQAIRNWIDGVNEPGAALLRGLADALGVDMDTLYPSIPKSLEPAGV